MSPEQASALLEAAYSETRSGNTSFARINERALQHLFGFSLDNQAALADFFTNVTLRTTENPVHIEGYVDFDVREVCRIAGKEYALRSNVGGIRFTQLAAQRDAKHTRR